MWDVEFTYPQCYRGSNFTLNPDSVARYRRQHETLMFNRLWNSFRGLTDVCHCCLVKGMEMSRKSGGEVFKIWMDFIFMALEAAAGLHIHYQSCMTLCSVI